MCYTFHIGLEVIPGIDLYSNCDQIKSGKAAQWVPMIDEVYRETDDFLALCRLRKMLLDFFVAHWPENPTVVSELPDSFHELIQFIKTESDAAMTVGALAERINMTPEAFSRKFSNLLKMPPKAFIKKCLLEKITSQLCDSNKTLRQIAGELNFSSEFYLSRFFKKAMGIPPATYKTMVNEKQG